MKNKKIQNILFALLFSATLGLAPFTPEPHLFQKWRWLLDGAVGMQAIDWFDLVMHSFPFLLLIFTIFDYFRSRKTAPEKSTNELK
ncbi:hypothetical protein G3O08_02810 [Cryomorpha ignava]|uniref:RND transporter n=1 Tax=Cryomorpha ignava TaxID=101383 RepID=A0A7K3WNJ7_9FLAO|nr:hypothetical protein [Cryomorpha ignava]NEN22432.1 hypothetical protein [Cryomorpha ignava]